MTASVGTGDTELAAFDNALWHAGIADYNLIALSSVIPPGCRVELARYPGSGCSDFGAKLYMVLSNRTEGEHGKEAWAGLGWVQAEDGRGLFVEQDGSQRAEVVRVIDATLKNMVDCRRIAFGPPQFETAGVTCQGRPVCALVGAVYEVVPWGRQHEE